MSTTKKRLSKLLASAGVASRRACEDLIFAGKVTLNGEIVTLPQTLASWDDRIFVNGKQIAKEERKVYYMLNKPTGFICSSKRIGSKKLVIDLFAPLSERLFTVGRLDRDTSGLILITNDGLFAQKVIHPSFGLTKEYLIKTRQEISHEHLVSISEGAMIEGCWIRPVSVTKVRKGTLKIIVQEGKKREVRLLLGKADLEILSLHRIRLGPLTLGSLPLGGSRELTKNEIQILSEI